MSNEKHSHRDRFTWDAGDIEIIKVPETKPVPKQQDSPAAGQTDAAERHRCLTRVRREVATKKNEVSRRAFAARPIDMRHMREAMYEAQNPQTLEAILPRLVSDDRVRSALAERFGPRADDVRRRVEAGERLEEEDRGAIIEEVEELLAQVGDVALTLPPEAEENEYYGEENMIVYVKVFKSFYWVDAPEFESGDAYFDSLEGAVRHAKDEYGHIFGANGDE